MRSNIGVILMLLVSFWGHAVTNSVGLKAALKAGSISLMAQSNGNSFAGKALTLHLKNKTKNAMNIVVEPALVFRPADSIYQDLVLPGQEVLALEPGAAGDLTVQTFCGKASYNAPGNHLDYLFKGQGDSTMIKVLNFVRIHSLLESLGQQVVWALTDFHNLDGIYDPKHPKESQELVALMVKLTGGKTPGYFKVYKLDTTAGQPAFVKRILKIVAVMEWKLDAPQPVSLGVYNAKDELVQAVLEEKEMKKGGYKMNVEFQAEGAEMGNYFLRLKSGDTVMKELKVTVD